MVWLITGLLLALLLGGLAVLTRRARRRPVTDDTLIADLLGTPAGQALAPPGRVDVKPPPVQAVQSALPARMDAEPRPMPAVQCALPARMDAEPRPVPAAQSAPAGRMDDEPSPVQAVPPAREDNWLEAQLAFITAWSERMQEQITSAAAVPDSPRQEPELASAGPPAGSSRPVGQSSEPPPSRRAPGRCLATTSKGSQCKLPATPGDTTCSIHAERAHP